MTINTKLNPPATTEDIQQFEQAYGITLPQRFIDIHTAFDGRPRSGGIAEGWLSIDDMRAMIERWQDLIAEHFGDSWQLSAKPNNRHPQAVKTALYNSQWIPFLRIKNVLWCLDYAPAADGRMGQIIRADTATDTGSYCVSLQADSFDQWLDRLAADPSITPAVQQQIRRLTAAYKQKYQTEPLTKADTSPYKPQIKQHIEKHIGPVKAIFREENTGEQPIDVFWLAAEEDKRPYHALISCGMSAHPMTLPDGVQEGAAFRLGELVVLLPEDWPIGIGVFSDPRNYWPVHWLKTLARLPAKTGGWIGEGQTIANGENAALIEDTPYGGMLLFPPLITLPEAFSILETDSGALLRFLTLIPLTPQEIHYKNRYGLQALLECFARLPNITDIIPTSRSSCVD